MQDQNLSNHSVNLAVTVAQKRSYKKYIALLILIFVFILVAFELREVSLNSDKKLIISPLPSIKPTISEVPRPIHKSKKYNYTVVLPKPWVQTRDLNIENLEIISNILSDKQKQIFNKYLSSVDMMFIDPKSDNVFKNRLYVRVKDKKTYTLKDIINEEKGLLGSFNKIDLIKDESSNDLDKKKHEMEAKMNLALLSFHGKSTFFENNDFIFVITGISFEEKWFKGFEEIYNQIISTFIM